LFVGIHTGGVGLQETLMIRGGQPWQAFLGDVGHSFFIVIDLRSGFGTEVNLLSDCRPSSWFE